MYDRPEIAFYFVLVQRNSQLALEHFVIPQGKAKEVTVEEDTVTA